MNRFAFVLLLKALLVTIAITASATYWAPQANAQLWLCRSQNATGWYDCGSPVVSQGWTSYNACVTSVGACGTDAAAAVAATAVVQNACSIPWTYTSGWTQVSSGAGEEIEVKAFAGTIIRPGYNHQTGQYGCSTPSPPLDFVGNEYRNRLFACPGKNWSGPVKESGVRACYRVPDCPPDGCPPGLRQLSAFGNPVFAKTLAKVQTVVDYRGEGPFPIEFSRTYRSIGNVMGASNASPFESDLGPNWLHSYGGSLTIRNGPSSGELYATLNRPGTGLRYYRGTGNTLIADTGQRDELIKTYSGGTPTGWKRLRSDNVSEFYDTNGFLARLEDGKGHFQTLNYSGSGQLTSVVDAFGKTLALNYGTYDILSSITLPDGRSIAFGTSTYLTNITYSEDGPQAFREATRLNSVTYQDSSVLSYPHEDTNDPQWLSGIVDETSTRIATYSRTYTSGSLSSVTTSYAGGVNQYVVNRPTYSYENYSNTTTPLGTTTRTTFGQYSGQPRLTQLVECFGSTPSCSARTRTFTYTDEGEIATSTDWNGVVTSYTFDSTRRVETTRIEARYTAVQRKIVTDWHSTFRLPTKETVKNAADTSIKETTYSYDATGNLTGRTIKDVASNTTRSWSWTHTYSSSAPWQILQTVENGPRTDVTDTTTTEYWAHDATCADPDPISGVTNLGCRGNLKSLTNAAGHVTTFDAYDHHGRLIRMTQPSGAEVALTYQSRGWLTDHSVTAGGVTESTQYQYYANGLLKKVIQPDGSFLEYGYDAAQRPTSVTDNLGNSITYTLDAMGNRTKEETKDTGNTLRRNIDRVFDTLNRLSTVTGALQ